MSTLGLSYSITGDNSGLTRAIEQSIAAISNLQKSVSGVNFFPNGGAAIDKVSQAVTGLTSGLVNVSKTAKQSAADLNELQGAKALDDLGRKLLVIQGNATLFGDSIKNQTSELAAYQSALNSLLELGFNPLDGDVTRLKTKIDDLTASLQAVSQVKVRNTISEQGFAPSAENIQNNNQGFAGNATDLSNGAAANLAAASSANQALAQSAQQASEAIQQEDGYIQGLKQAITDLNATKFGASFDQLPVINAEIQELEVSLKQASNIGKVGFDEFGNALKGVNISNVNGQLFALQNNLFGARQISKDLVRTIDAGSLSGFAKAVGLLATDFLFYAQSAQFAQGATVATTAAIGAEGAVATGTALSVGGLGAAFSSLLNPTTAIVLGIAALGAAFVAYEKSQKTATQAATEHLKAIREQKAALDDVLTTLSAQEQVQAKAAETTGQEVAKLGELYLALQNQISVGKDYTAQLVDLQNEFPRFFANIDLATDKTNALSVAFGKAKNAVEALGLVAAANTLSAGSDVDVVKNKAAYESLIPQIQVASAQLEKLQKTQDNLKGSDLQFGGGSQIVKAIEVQKGAVNDLINQFTKYSQSATDAQNKSDQFLQIAAKNQQAADALNQPDKGSVAFLQQQLDLLKKIEPELATQAQRTANITEQKRLQAQIDADNLKNEKSRTVAANEYLSVIQSINDILSKSLGDANKSGLTGYAQQVASINAQYVALNESLQKANLQIDKQAAIFKVTNGKSGFNPTQVSTAKGLVSSATGVLSNNEDKQLNDAQITEAQRVSDEITRINNEFGVKAAEGRAKDVASLQATADKEIAIQQTKIETQQQIDDRYNLAIGQANGDEKRIADANRLKDAEIAANKSAADAIILINQDKETALEAINQKYLDKISELSGKITEINDFAIATQLGTEESATDRIVKEWETRRDAANKYYNQIKQIAASFSGSVNAGVAGAGLGSDTAAAINGFVQKSISGAQGTTNDNITGGQNQSVFANSIKPLTDALKQGLQSGSKEILSTIQGISSLADKSFGSIFSNITAGFSKAGESIFEDILSRQLAASLTQSISKNIETTANLSATASTNSLSTSITGLGTSATSAASKTQLAAASLNKIASGIAVAGLVGSVISADSSPTSKLGQGLGGALSLGATGALAGLALGGPVGAVIGGGVGLIAGALGGIFGASKAQKELQAQQLEQQKEQTALLKASLAYTSQIIGRQTANGIISDISVGATGQLVATVSGSDLQFVLDRNGKVR